MSRTYADFSLAVYMSFIYGLLYLCLTAFELIFTGVHGFAPGIEGLPYMALIVGVFIGLGAFMITNRSYVKKLEANNNVPVPEWRLPLAMLGGTSFTISEFSSLPRSRRNADIARRSLLAGLDWIQGEHPLDCTYH